MKKEMNERARALADVVKKIEKWCNDNVIDNGIKVFNLHPIWDAYVWHAWMYSTELKSVLLAQGDHGSYGAFFSDMETGMPHERFLRYMNEGHDPAKADYERTNEEGNLVYEKEIKELMLNWEDIKRRLKEANVDKQKFENFTA